MSIYKKSKTKFWILIGAVFVATLVLDQVTKNICQTQIGEGETVPFLGKFMYFIYIKNYGASFGMLSNWEYRNVLFFIFTLIGIPAFIYLLFRRRNASLWGSIGLSLMISGTLGNAIDRAVFSTNFFDGYVRDFICVPWFATFNIADSCMCVGVAMVILAMLFFDSDSLLNNHKKNNHKNDESEIDNDDKIADKDESIQGEPLCRDTFDDGFSIDDDFDIDDDDDDNEDEDDDLDDFNSLSFELLNELDIDIDSDFGEGQNLGK